MIKHGNYWLEDGSVLIIVEDTIYRLYRFLLSRLSPRFFEDCCEIASVSELDHITAGSNSLPCFAIRHDLKITKRDFDALVAHILHDIALSDESPFPHILRLYIVSSEKKGDFKKIYRAVEKQLDAYMQKNPLDIDFSDYTLLENALEVSNRTDNLRLKTLLRRALYYSYATHDDVLLADGNATDPSATADESGSKQISEPTSKHITGSDAAKCERLMSQLSDNFSPTLFQPPAALHMQCTEVYAGLWMERAVQPAFADNGTADPFSTLGRLRSLDWKREVDGSEDESQPCSDCLEHMRQQWSNEAQSIWEEMDSWLLD